jgi:hypothetical protein
MRPHHPHVPREEANPSLTIFDGSQLGRGVEDCRKFRVGPRASTRLGIWAVPLLPVQQNGHEASRPRRRREYPGQWRPRRGDRRRAGRARGARRRRRPGGPVGRRASSVASERDGSGRSARSAAVAGVDGPDRRVQGDAGGRRRTAGRRPADRATDGRAGTTPALAGRAGMPAASSSGGDGAGLSPARGLDGGRGGRVVAGGVDGPS